MHGYTLYPQRLYFILMDILAFFIIRDIATPKNHYLSKKIKKIFFFLWYALDAQHTT